MSKQQSAHLVDYKSPGKFRWRQHGGRLLNPVSMDIKHLFNTVRMLKNNLKAKPDPDISRVYYLSPVSYPPEYLEFAVVGMELVYFKRIKLIKEAVKAGTVMIDEY